MAKSKNPSTLLLSPVVRLSYPKLIKAEPFKDPTTGQEKGDPVFNTEMLCPADDLSKFRTWNEEKGEWKYDNLNSFCGRLAKQRFGDDFDVGAAIKHDGIKWPVTNGDKNAERGEKYEHYAGHYVVRGKALSEINGRPNAPSLYYMEDGKRKAIARGTDQGNQLAGDMFYGGAWVVVELSAVAGDAGGNKYVTLYMNSVMFIRNDDKFGGGNSLMDRFEGVTGGESDYDPTDGMEEEISI